MDYSRFAQQPVALTNERLAIVVPSQRRIVGFCCPIIMTHYLISSQESLSRSTSSLVSCYFKGESFREARPERSKPSIIGRFIATQKPQQKRKLFLHKYKLKKSSHKVSIVKGGLSDVFCQRKPMVRTVRAIRSPGGKRKGSPSVPRNQTLGKSMKKIVQVTIRDSEPIPSVLYIRLQSSRSLADRDHVSLQ